MNRFAIAVALALPFAACRNEGLAHPSFEVLYQDHDSLLNKDSVRLSETVPASVVVFYHAALSANRARDRRNFRRLPRAPREPIPQQCPARNHGRAGVHHRVR